MDDSVNLYGNEVWSTKYPGYILMENGNYRRRNKNTEGNHYLVELPCTNCGKLHLAYAHNSLGHRKWKNTSCSKECRYAIAHKPDGSTKKKRGLAGDDHIMVKALNHPGAKKGYVPLHRLIMEKILGRYLEAKEVVHHINCIKSDNRPENLVLCSSMQQHFAAHGSLNKCVASMIESGFLKFDEKSMSYFTENQPSTKR